MAQAEVREYAAKASSTDTFGRVMCNSRDHHSRRTVPCGCRLLRRRLRAEAELPHSAPSSLLQMVVTVICA
jgi:hypothetical protein